MTISSEITNILNDLGTRLGVAVDWSSANVVPYMQELVSRIAKLEIATSIIWLVVAIISTIICVISVRKMCKVAKSGDANMYEEELTYSVGFACTFIFGILALVGYIWAACTIPQAVFLPELTAIEYIQNLMK